MCSFSPINFCKNCFFSVPFSFPLFLLHIRGTLTPRKLYRYFREKISHCQWVSIIHVVFRVSQRCKNKYRHYIWYSNIIRLHTYIGNGDLLTAFAAATACLSKYHHTVISRYIAISFHRIQYNASLSLSHSLLFRVIPARNYANNEKRYYIKLEFLWPGSFLA